MIKRIALLSSLVWMIVGCASMDKFIVDLHKDGNVSSCIYYQGNVPGYASMRGVTATGSATVDVCLKER